MSLNVDSAVWVSSQEVKDREVADLWIESTVESKLERKPQVFEVKVRVFGKEITITGKANAIEESLKLRYPLINIFEEDLLNIPELNEPEILSFLYRRFERGLIATYAGSILLAMNPFEEVKPHASSARLIQDFANSILRDTLDPRVQSTRAILVSGESGSGKTEISKMVLKAFGNKKATTNINNNNSNNNGNTAGNTANNNNTTAAAASTNVSSFTASDLLVSKMMLANKVLESFGNARTATTANSSRFGKLVHLFFSREGEIAGCTINTYLLETSRIVTQQEGERNYNIFYQLLAHTNEEDRAAWRLYTLSSNDLSLTNQGGTQKATMIAQDSKQFQEFLRSMDALGFEEQALCRLFQVLCGVLFLGEIRFDEYTDKERLADTHNHSEALRRMVAHMQTAAELLGVSRSELEALMLKKVFVTKKETVEKDLEAKQAIIARDALVKLIYKSAFDWVVQEMNHMLRPLERDDLSRRIMLLDMFGFDSFQRNSIDQLCINYVNEALQEQFNEHVFRMEVKLYEEEGIKYEKIKFSDNKDNVDLIVGLFKILDDQCRLPSPTDRRFYGLVYKQFENNRLFNASKSQQRASQFSITHFAGVVEYTADDFIVKNIDNAPATATKTLFASTNETLRAIFAPMNENAPNSLSRQSGRNLTGGVFNAHQAHTSVSRGTESKHASVNMSAVEEARGVRAKSVMFGGKGLKDELNAFANTQAQTQTQTQTQTQQRRTERTSMVEKIKTELNLLLRQIEQASPSYIRCVKPFEKQWLADNNNNSTITIGARGVLVKQSSMSAAAVPLSASAASATAAIGARVRFNQRKVAQQLHYGGVFEAVRIARSGFRSRFTYTDFFGRYRLLARSFDPHYVEPHLSTTEPSIDEAKRVCRTLVEALSVRENKPKGLIEGGNLEFGKTRIFIRKREYDLLEMTRNHSLSSSLVRIQAVVRGFCKFRRWVLMRTNVVHLQRVVRGHLARKWVKIRKILLVSVITLQRRFRRKRFFRGIVRLQAVARRHLAMRRVKIMQERRARLIAIFGVFITGRELRTRRRQRQRSHPHERRRFLCLPSPEQRNEERTHEEKALSESLARVWASSATKDARREDLITRYPLEELCALLSLRTDALCERDKRERERLLSVSLAARYRRLQKKIHHVIAMLSPAERLLKIDLMRTPLRERIALFAGVHYSYRIKNKSSRSHSSNSRNNNNENNNASTNSMSSDSNNADNTNNNNNNKIKREKVRERTVMITRASASEVHIHSQHKIFSAIAVRVHKLHKLDAVLARELTLLTQTQTHGEAMTEDELRTMAVTEDDEMNLIYLSDKEKQSLRVRKAHTTLCWLRHHLACVCKYYEEFVVRFVRSFGDASSFCISLPQRTLYVKALFAKIYELRNTDARCLELVEVTPMSVNNNNNSNNLLPVCWDEEREAAQKRAQLKRCEEVIAEAQEQKSEILCKLALLDKRREELNTINLRTFELRGVSFAHNPRGVGVAYALNTMLELLQGSFFTGGRLLRVERARKRDKDKDREKEKETERGEKGPQKDMEKERASERAKERESAVYEACDGLANCSFMDVLYSPVSVEQIESHSFTATLLACCVLGVFHLQPQHLRVCYEKEAAVPLRGQVLAELDVIRITSFCPDEELAERFMGTGKAAKQQLQQKQQQQQQQTTSNLPLFNRMNSNNNNHNNGANNNNNNNTSMYRIINSALGSTGSVKDNINPDKATNGSNSNVKGNAHSNTHGVVLEEMTADAENLSFLFFLPQMDEPVDPDVRAFLTTHAYKPEEMVCSWLRDMHELSERAKAHTLSASFTAEELRALRLPVSLPRGKALSVCARLRLFCRLLAEREDDDQSRRRANTLSVSSQQSLALSHAHSLASQQQQQRLSLRKQLSHRHSHTLTQAHTHSQAYFRNFDANRSHLSLKNVLHRDILHACAPLLGDYYTYAREHAAFEEGIDEVSAMVSYAHVYHEHLFEERRRAQAHRLRLEKIALSPSLSLRAMGSIKKSKSSFRITTNEELAFDENNGYYGGGKSDDVFEFVNPAIMLARNTSRPLRRASSSNSTSIIGGRSEKRSSLRRRPGERSEYVPLSGRNSRTSSFSDNSSVTMSVSMGMSVGVMNSPFFSTPHTLEEIPEEGNDERGGEEEDDLYAIYASPSERERDRERDRDKKQLKKPSSVFSMRNIALEILNEENENNNDNNNDKTNDGHKGIVRPPLINTQPLTLSRTHIPSHTPSHNQAEQHAQELLLKQNFAVHAASPLRKTRSNAINGVKPFSPRGRNIPPTAQSHSTPTHPQTSPVAAKVPLRKEETIDSFLLISPTQSEASLTVDSFSLSQSQSNAKARTREHAQRIHRARRESLTFVKASSDTPQNEPDLYSAVYGNKEEEKETHNALFFSAQELRGEKSFEQRERLTRREQSGAEREKDNNNDNDTVDNSVSSSIVRNTETLSHAIVSVEEEALHFLASMDFAQVQRHLPRREMTRFCRLVAENLSFLPVMVLENVSERQLRSMFSPWLLKETKLVLCVKELLLRYVGVGAKQCIDTLKSPVLFLLQTSLGIEIKVLQASEDVRERDIERKGFAHTQTVRQTLRRATSHAPTLALLAQDELSRQVSYSIHAYKPPKLLLSSKERKTNEQLLKDEQETEDEEEEEEPYPLMNHALYGELEKTLFACLNLITTRDFAIAKHKLELVKRVLREVCTYRHTHGEDTGAHFLGRETVSQLVEIVIQYPALASIAEKLAERRVFVREKLLLHRLLRHSLVDRFVSLLLIVLRTQPHTLWTTDSECGGLLPCDIVKQFSENKRCKYKLLCNFVNFASNQPFNAGGAIFSSFRGEEELIVRAAQHGLLATEKELKIRTFDLEKKCAFPFIPSRNNSAQGQCTLSTPGSSTQAKDEALLWRLVVEEINGSENTKQRCWETYEILLRALKQRVVSITNNNSSYMSEKNVLGSMTTNNNNIIGNTRTLTALEIENLLWKSLDIENKSPEKCLIYHVNERTLERSRVYVDMKTHWSKHSGERVNKHISEASRRRFVQLRALTANNYRQSLRSIAESSSARASLAREDSLRRASISSASLLFSGQGEHDWSPEDRRDARNSVRSAASGSRLSFSFAPYSSSSSNNNNYSSSRNSFALDVSTHRQSLALRARNSVAVDAERMLAINR